MAYDFYTACLATTSTPAEDHREKLQELVNSQFDNSSSIFDIEEEYPMASGVKVDIQVRINHMINIDTGVRLGDDWRKLIFKDFNRTRALGQKYYFDGYTWLTVNTDMYKYPTASINIRRCNWVLKWYDASGFLRQEDCVVEYVKMIASAMGTLEGRSVRQGTYDRFVYLQKNANTLVIKRDQRFFIDGLVFRVTKSDTVAHNGLVELSLDEHQINEEVDDIVNQIADYKTRESQDNSNTGTTETIFGETYLTTGLTGVWEVYKKINGAKQADTYTFSIINTGATIISQTGNTVNLKGGNLIGETFTLRATNNITSAVVNKNITVSGMW